ncbi:MAG TPA: fatty acid desaturase [Acidiferrobacteraceae bacterium]|nr:fatty acid desaturase [Acidiferrobacteraceae bacterium]
MNQQNTAATAEPTISELRKSLGDLFAPQPVLYWVDFLASASLGWAGYGYALQLSMGSGLWMMVTLVSALALYRAVIFTHELTHLRPKAIPGFSLVWNALCGIPLMVPSFMYRRVHMAHHVKTKYGTKEDGEYLAFANKHPAQILIYLLSSFLLPPLAATRFIVLAPLSLVIPSLRRWLAAHGSSLSIDPGYIRPIAGADELLSWRVQEAAASVLGMAVIGALVFDLLPMAVLFQWYLISVLILTMNALRTLGAHHYRNANGKMSFVQQIQDSVNVTGQPLLMILLAPLGMRYHALHHLFPTLPYHALGKSHRHLMKALPEGSWYAQVNCHSLWQPLLQLWREARHHQSQKARV